MAFLFATKESSPPPQRTMIQATSQEMSFGISRTARNMFAAHLHSFVIWTDDRKEIDKMVPINLRRGPSFFQMNENKNEEGKEKKQIQTKQGNPALLPFQSIWVIYLEILY